MSAVRTTRDLGRPGAGPFEVLAVVLLGLATLGTAWCGYQASRWNNEESDLARESSDLQVEAARQFGLATQVVSYDSNMVAQYARAAADGDENLKQFFRQTLMRPAFLPVLDRWEAQVTSGGGAPTSLLDDQNYLDDQLGDYRATQARAQQLSVDAQAAGAEGDDYVLTTILLASGLFFAGLTTSFRVRFARVLLLAGASLLLAYAASRLAGLSTV